MQVARRFNIAPCKPRAPTTWGLFPYDGNIIGGLLIGIGMALTGSCPGTVFVQLANGVPSCIPIAGGTILGGILYAGLKRQVPPSSSQTTVPVYDAIHTTEQTAAVALSALWGLAVYATTQLLPSNSEALLSPVLGGLAIAGAQAASISLTGNVLGVSTAYEQIGELFWWATDPKPRQEKSKRPPLASTVFAAGMVGGSWLLGRAFELPTLNEKSTGIFQAVAGGVLLSFGSRVGGGCTAGHGISGMASMGIASFITTAGMFGGGVAVGLALK